MTLSHDRKADLLSAARLFDGVDAAGMARLAAVVDEHLAPEINRKVESERGDPESAFAEGGIQVDETYGLPPELTLEELGLSLDWREEFDRASDEHRERSRAG